MNDRWLECRTACAPNALVVPCWENCSSENTTILMNLKGGSALQYIIIEAFSPGRACDGVYGENCDTRLRRYWITIKLTSGIWMFSQSRGDRRRIFAEPLASQPKLIILEALGCQILAEPLGSDTLTGSQMSQLSTHILSFEIYVWGDLSA